LTDEERRMFSNRLRERDAEIERLREENQWFRSEIAKYLRDNNPKPKE